MMVEKESGRIEHNEFESLWQKIAQSDRGLRYLPVDYPEK